jgi:hypothetical protein
METPQDTCIILIGTGETLFSVVLAIMSRTEEGVTWWQFAAGLILGRKVLHTFLFDLVCQFTYHGLYMVVR